MHPRLGLTCLLPLTFALACSDDVTYAETEAQTESGSTSTTTDATSDSTGMPGTETSTSTETETGDPGPYCGDGMLDLGEECDDGNDVEDDGCSTTCDSACGIATWIDITVPAGWFDVQAMDARPNGRLLAAGDVEAPGEVGRLRVVTANAAGVDGSIQSAPLGPAGTPDLPQTHQIDALALTQAGDVLALGTSTEVMVMGEPAITSYWLARFDGADLSQQWRVDIPADEEQRPLDVTLLSSGDAVVTMTTRVADNDTDIGFERRSGVDGTVMWTSSHTGELNGGWSLDQAAFVAAGPDDRLWAAGIVRVDWQTFETTLIELDPNDGAVMWTEVPLADAGNTQEQRVWDLAAGANGRVAVGITVFGPATAYHFSGAYMYTDQVLSWGLVPDDLPWDDGDPYVSPRVSIDEDGEALVVGSYTHDFEIATASRPWIVGLSPTGEQLCAARVGQGTEAGIAERIGFFGGGLGATNLDTYGPGGMGPMSDGNWIATLRGW